MWLLWFEVALLVLVLMTVGAMCIFLITDDLEIMNWLRTHRALAEAWTKQLIVRYRHKARHTPRYQAQQETKEWYLQSLAFSAT